MGNVRKTLNRVLSGSTDADMRLGELCRLLGSLGFESRIRGSHHIFWREGVEEILNRQPRDGGQANPYQVKQVRQVIMRHRLEPP